MFIDFLKHLFPRIVLTKNLKISYTLCLGGLSLTCFLVLAITGVLMAFYYSPSIEAAYQSILFLEENVFLGKYLRNLHKLASHTFLVLMFLHIIRVVLTGAFSPRSYNWVIGMGLLFLAIFEGYTGYLLPMDQLAYWATQTGIELIRLVPFGDQLTLLLAPEGVGGQLTLTRFYALHILVIPFLLIALMTIHFYKIRKDKGVLPYL